MAARHPLLAILGLVLLCLALPLSLAPRAVEAGVPVAAAEDAPDHSHPGHGAGNETASAEIGQCHPGVDCAPVALATGQAAGAGRVARAWQRVLPLQARAVGQPASYEPPPPRVAV